MFPSLYNNMPLCRLGLKNKPTAPLSRGKTHSLNKTTCWADIAIHNTLGRDPGGQAVCDPAIEVGT